MRKPTICLGKNKGADQLRSYCEADQRLKAQISFAVTAKLISAFVFATRIVQFLLDLNRKLSFKLLHVALFCDCTGRFMSDLFGNHIVGFPTRRLKLPALLTTGAA